MIIVSACLLGKNYRYDGDNNLSPVLNELLKDKEIKLVCPEVDGGLPIPRPPAEIVGGQGYDVLKNRALVKSKEGEDITSFFLDGSKRMLDDIDENEIEFAVLKARSPSCGTKEIYSGEFNGRLIPGPGVGAAFLKKKGIPVFSEEEINKIKEMLNS